MTALLLSRLSSRRRFVGAALAASLPVLWPRSAGAIGAGSQVGIGHLRKGPNWNERPGALRRLLWDTGKRTSIQVASEETPVTLLSTALFDFPLLVLSGKGAMPAWSRREREALARHLRYGGMLWIDAQSGADPFVASVEREMNAIFPSVDFAPLGKDHVLFKSFFLLGGAPGRTGVDERVQGITLAGRTPVVMTRSDVLGAYERDRFGTWRFDCEPGGSRQRERAFRFGVNVIMYATCLDYKADQVHIPFILKKKRR